MEILYRQLAEHEAERIKEIAPTDFIKRAWRKVGDVKDWVEINWAEDDFPDGYENHLAALKTTFKGGGYVAGAFNNERLIGFCSINREIFGTKHKYTLLDQLFVAPEYRRKGIGIKLFFICAEQAKTWGADKFYICSGSSEATLYFYINLGCENVQEVNHDLLEESDILAEYDIHLEYDFNSIPLPIKTKRIYITKFYETMAQSTHEMSLDGDNRRFVPDEVFETVESARDAINNIASFYSDSGAPQIFAVFLNDGRHIGHVQAVPQSDEWEIGYHIAKPFTGKGYATEAVKAFLPVIMKRLCINRINGMVHAENTASRKVLEKCGFLLESEGLRDYHGSEQPVCKYVYGHLEEMAEFFNTRAETYENHMLGDLKLDEFYELIADCTNTPVKRLLDLGAERGFSLNGCLKKIPIWR